VATILIAEDEPAILSMMARGLEEAGYTLVIAESATQAKAKSDAFQGAIDLLITNHMLRDGLGRDVGDYISKKRPTMKVLQVSGHPYQELKVKGHLVPDAAFLAKPFDRHAITAKVNEVLGRDGEVALGRS
jgi:two-component system cell cycle sensor histidine kinase/response regulator CckA